MSTLLERVQADLTKARRERDNAATTTLGTLLADIRNRDIELGRAPTDDEVIDVIRRGIKRRRESVEMYTKGQRQDLAAKETVELSLLELYLPQQASADEIRAAVRQAIEGGASNVGAIIGKVLPSFKGRADGAAVSAIVREELAARG